ncbi:MAG TPA: RDD family protein [Burkholderiales bacterium]|nr:RDD family protein [Burkholderiales bacterium]
MASSWSSSPDYAGFWQRAAAFAIDALIVTVVLVPLMVVVFGMRRISLDPAQHSWDLLAIVAIVIALIGFWRYCGATPGKIALGVRIVDAATGQPPTLLRLALRFVGYFVSALPLYLGFLWIAVDRRKQGWHDKIARTIVINSED